MMKAILSKAFYRCHCNRLNSLLYYVTNFIRDTQHTFDDTYYLKPIYRFRSLE